MILYRHKKNRDTAIEIMDEFYDRGIKKASVVFYNIRPEYYENGKPFVIGTGEIRIRPEREYVKLKF